MRFTRSSIRQSDMDATMNNRTVIKIVKENCKNSALLYIKDYIDKNNLPLPSDRALNFM